MNALKQQVEMSITGYLRPEQTNYYAYKLRISQLYQELVNFYDGLGYNGLNVRF